MVTVKAAYERVGKDDKPFVSLELNGDLELVQSQNTGRFYATLRRCFISSTFDLETANNFVGHKLPGKIVRVQCDPYEFKVPETGEDILLGHRYDYVPDEAVPNSFQPVKSKLQLEEQPSEESVFEEMS